MDNLPLFWVYNSHFFLHFFALSALTYFTQPQNYSSRCLLWHLKMRVHLLTAPSILVIWVVTHPSTIRGQCCLTSVINVYEYVQRGMTPFFYRFLVFLLSSSNFSLKNTQKLTLREHTTFNFLKTVWTLGPWLACMADRTFCVGSPESLSSSA
jgi:hypothetical protein